MMLLPLTLLSALALPELPVFTLDPVEACFGREVPGSVEWTRTRGRFVYRFASEDSALLFDLDPESYEIQLGGGCARMGALSRVGDPERYTVYGGRLYIFASDGCREGFLESPESLLPRIDPTPTPDEAALRAGQVLLRRALTGFGGREALRGLGSMHMVHEEIVGEGAEPVVTRRELSFHASGSLSLVRSAGDWRQEVHWREGTGVLGDGVFVDGEEVFELHPSQRRAAFAELHREPLWLLLQRNNPHMVVWAEPDLDGLAVLACHLDGETTRLLLDENGQVAATLRRDRSPSLGFTEVRTAHKDSLNLEGFVFSAQRSATARSKPIPSLDRHWTEIAVNTPLPPVPERAPR